MKRSTLTTSLAVSLLALGSFAVVIVHRFETPSRASIESGDADDNRAGRDDGTRSVAAAKSVQLDSLTNRAHRRTKRISADAVRTSRRAGSRARQPSRAFALLRSRDPGERCRGVRALEAAAEAGTAPAARAAIRRALSDTHASVRLEAVQSLTDLDDRTSVQRIRELLDDPSPSVRGETVAALVQLGDDAEVDAIAALAGDSDAGVRADAAAALGRFESYVGLDRLVALLEDSDADVRSEAMRSLRRLGAPSALPALAELYTSTEGPPSFELLDAMRRLGDEEPLRREVDRLAEIALAGDEVEARYEAIQTLAREAPSNAREVFRRALNDPSARVRKAASRAVKSAR